MAARKRNKYRAVKTNGFASRFEARVANELERYCADNGWSLDTQHAIKFACGAKYLVDFLVRSAHGTPVLYVEAKGRSLPVWRLKMRLLKHEYPDIFKNLTVVYARNEGGKLKPKWGGWV